MANIMQNGRVSLMAGIFAFIFTSGLGYIVKGKVNWIASIGIMLGFWIAYFISKRYIFKRAVGHND